jgi:penicillin amidase
MTGVTAAVAEASLYLVSVILAAAGAAIVLAVLAFGWRLRASLPLLNGEVPIDGLEHPVRIDRDTLGVPIVSGTSRKDIFVALGFLHAQERFFQMDLSRRAAAGELAELFGKVCVTADRQARVHRFRARAREIASALPAHQQEILRSYAAGVNAGLRSLRKPPFEYMFLRSRPSDWRAEDTLIIAFYMYYLLHDHRADQDFNSYLLYSALPEQAADFLTPAGSPDWDAPLVGEMPPCPDIPGPHILDFRRTPPERDTALSNARPAPGSNAWAVSGARSGTGRAILGNDMHLPFSMPPPLYRATLEITRPGARKLSGVTLPGFPFLIAGTNGDVACGLANASTDSVDLVRLDQAGLDSSASRTPTGVARTEAV